MGSTAPIIDLAPVMAITQNSLDRVAVAIRNCSRGMLRGDRAAPARHVLVAEARAIVKDEIARNLSVEPIDLVGYISLYQDALDVDVSGGTLGSAIEYAVKSAVEEEVMNDIHPLLVEARQNRTLDALAADISEIRTEILDLIPTISSHRLRRLVDEAMEDRDGANLMELSEELDRVANDLRTLIHRLDIADPPPADYAGRGRRRLLEASDFINLSVAFVNMDEFLAPMAKPSP
jgi:hypothetical protein